MDVKEVWNELVKDRFFCIKTVDDFWYFANFVESKLGVNREESRYLHRLNPDIMRLRQQFCSAWINSKAGLSYDPSTYSANELALLLTKLGLPSEKHHIQNAKKKSFIPHSCPATSKVKSILHSLSKTFPTLDISMFVPSNSAQLYFGRAEQSLFADRLAASS